MADIKQSQQMIPFITCKTAFCQDVCKLILGVDVFDLDLWGQDKSDRTTNEEQLNVFWKHVGIDTL